MSGPREPMDRIEDGIMMLAWMKAHWADLQRIQSVVQENQKVFGNPIAGADCIKLAAKYLEKRVADVKASQS
jgi:hypothetical protein